MHAPSLRRARRSRRGTVLLLTAICLVGLCGFMALAIDIGMMAVAKTEIQNAADAAALGGARSVDGSASPNLAGATDVARQAAMGNGVLAATLATTDVTVVHGAYHYDRASETFAPQYPPVAPDTYNLTRATVSRTFNTGFARTFGVATYDVTASATAAHRPRDVSIILDYSGSMNNESDLWNNEGYLGSANNSPNSRDSVYPQFGHYSDTANAKLRCTSSDPRVGKSNVTTPALGVPALINDFYQHDRGSAAMPAFPSAGYDPTHYYAQSQPGDRFLTTQDNSTGTFAATTADIFPGGGSSRNWKWELDGYAGYAANLTDQETYPDGSFSGYTRGPNHWGKSFFLWPPDPRAGPVDQATAFQFLQDIQADDPSLNWRPSGNKFRNGNADVIRSKWPWPTEAALQAHLKNNVGLASNGKSYGRIMRLHNRPDNDWRRRFFLNPGGSYPNFGGPVDDNTALWDSSGNWLNPQGNYVINYKAILAWIKQDPCPFPPQLRAGRILYYDQIPDDVPASAYDHTRGNDQITDQNQRFWKEYIDYALGVWRDPYNNIQNPGKPACSYGPDWGWKTVKINGKPSSTSYQAMNYLDNPERPRHRMWFGPMTMVQYISDTGMLPGTAHDISMYPAKLGISGALQDIKNNHPNDLVSLILFSRPQYSNDPVGAFTQAQFGLSRDYNGMIDALWFPPDSSATDVRPWDAAGRQTPRAFGDFTSNTATQHGFMLAYNQFSASADIRNQSVGGLGRKGAQRLVVLETDGMANVNTKPKNGFYNGGPGRSYYRILPGDTFTPTGYNEGDLLDVVRRIVAREDDNLAGPGFSTARKPVQIHTVAFGAIFEPSAAGTSDQNNSVGLLQKISAIGGTTFPSASVDASNGYKWCIGTLDERKDKLRQAFSRIMDDGISISLIE